MEPNLYSTPKRSSNKREQDTPSDTPSTCDSTRSSNSDFTISSIKSISPPLFPVPKLNSIGSSWTVEMTILQKCGSSFEIKESLRCISLLLDEIDESDRNKFCRSDYLNSVKVLRKKKHLWSDDVFREAVAIELKYFNANHLAKLPDDIIVAILLWLPISSVFTMLSLSKNMNRIASLNTLWRMYYCQKFPSDNPSEDIYDLSNMKLSFQKRLNDPEVGDKIEVAWDGKFRLETQEVYEGMAWWLAEVVDKHTKLDKYKIHYPGWESRWDEWVCGSHKIRWAVKANAVEQLYPGDSVELWCCGANVPGAWLETKVLRIKCNRYCISGVISDGHIWVERGRLRKVNKRVYRAVETNEEGSDGWFGTGDNVRRSMLSLVGKLSQRFGIPDSNDSEEDSEEAIDRDFCTIS